MEGMDSAGAGQKHERALPGHYLNAMFLAKPNRFLAHRTLTTGTIHPDAADACGGAVGNATFDIPHFVMEQKMLRGIRDRAQATTD